MGRRVNVLTISGGTFFASSLTAYANKELWFDMKWETVLDIYCEDFLS